jgi:hypothetical protein
MPVARHVWHPTGVRNPAALARFRIAAQALYRLRARPVNVPALVVAGDRDSVCKPEASERMHRDIPDAQLTRLIPAKHMDLIEHHTRFAEIVKTFAFLGSPSVTKWTFSTPRSKRSIDTNLFLLIMLHIIWSIRQSGDDAMDIVNSVLDFTDRHW